jgi:hypothetical protein
MLIDDTSFRIMCQILRLYENAHTTMESKQDNKHLLSRYIGPGAWYTLHMAAANTQTDEDNKAVLYLINAFRKHFACLSCRKHFDEFYSKLPPDTVTKSGEAKGKYFYWTFLAHNNANSIIGKKQLSFFEAELMYYGDKSVCSEDCADVTNSPPESKTSSPQRLMDFLPNLDDADNHIEF